MILICQKKKEKKKPSEQNIPSSISASFVPVWLTPSCYYGGIFHASLRTPALWCSISQCSHLLKELIAPLSLSCLISISLFTTYWMFFIGIQMSLIPHFRKEEKQKQNKNLPCQLLLIWLSHFTGNTSR